MGANIEIKKTAGGKSGGEKKQLAWRLEPEGKSETDNTVAQSVPDYVIGHAGIGKAHEWSLLRPCEPGVFNVGIDALEVRMIEHILERCVKFQARAFVHLDVLEHCKIGDVSNSVL
jgi:hypothetical protein